MPIRAKFKLVTVTRHAYEKGGHLVFEPRYETSIPEDQRFAEATPSGKLEMYIDSPAALACFTLGENYYFDATPAAGSEATSN